jgi:Fe-S-cluster-containing dehydrogenase component
MGLNRRQFLRTTGLAGIAAGGVGVRSATASAAAEGHDDSFGVLVDIPNCIGCRKCEFACQRAAGFDTPPIEAYDDKSVFERHRRPDPSVYTTINRFENPHNADVPLYVKSNCLHCNEPACVSACLVGALQKDATGAVVYDPWKCMGCRYCMVACPFGIPAYDYHDAFAPQVRKCTFCFDRISKEGGVPACVQICPRECLIFGKREELLREAHARIRDNPDRYIDHVYGEHEAGGTAWLYLSGVPFERLGFLTIGSSPPSQLTETIQHGVFKNFLPPLALYGLLGLLMWLGQPEPRTVAEAHGCATDGSADSNGRAGGRNEGGALPAEGAPRGTREAVGV